MQGNPLAHLYELAREVGSQLKAQGALLVTAESCTGGWLGKVITEVPGSSEWYFGGWVVYSNRAKQEFLRVREETLVTYGAVSQETAKELVEGALHLTPATYAISITGIAGPSGGSEMKPVGTVYTGFGKKNGSCLVHHLQFPEFYTREMIRFLTVNQVLMYFLDFLRNQGNRRVK